MATVDKNFRIKNGLVVEGTTATVNGENILREGSSDNYIINLIGGSATSNNTADSVVLRDGTGSFAVQDITLDGTLYGTSISNSGTITITSSSNDIVLDADGWVYAGSANSQNIVATRGRVDNLIGDITVDSSGGNTITDRIATAKSEAISDSNFYADSLASNYDAAGSATTAENNAKSYADGLASNYDAAGAATTAENNAKSYADGLASNYDAAGSAYTAEQNAKSYADSLIDDNSTTTTNVWSAYKVDSEIGTAVANLVDSAPALLDTLNELAAAIADNPNYASDMATSLGNKQDTLTASTGITIDGSNNISVTANTYDAYGAASTAESNANSYTDTAISNGLTGYVTETGSQTLSNKTLDNPEISGEIKLLDSNNTWAAYITLENDELMLDTDARNIVFFPEAGGNVYLNDSNNSDNIVATQGDLNSAIGSIDSAVTQINGASISPNNVTINSVANQYATSTTGINVADGVSSVFGVSATTYRTLKALVKAKSGSHTQVSEILVTLDASNNVAITEYAMVGTNGSLGNVSAIYHGSGNIFVTFEPTYDNTDVMVYATALV